MDWFLSEIVPQTRGIAEQHAPFDGKRQPCAAVTRRSLRTRQAHAVLSKVAFYAMRALLGTTAARRGKCAGLACERAFNDGEAWGTNYWLHGHDGPRSSKRETPNLKCWIERRQQHKGAHL